MSPERTVADLGQYAAQVAAKRSWVVNPDTVLTGPVLEGLTAKLNRTGRPYCPCRDQDGPEGYADLVCPCAYAAADIDEYGQCYCGLFLSATKNPRDVSSIPERRPGA